MKCAFSESEFNGAVENSFATPLSNADEVNASNVVEKATQILKTLGEEYSLKDSENLEQAVNICSDYFEDFVKMENDNLSDFVLNKDAIRNGLISYAQTSPKPNIEQTTTDRLEKLNDKEELQKTFTNSYLLESFGNSYAAKRYCKQESTKLGVNCLFYTSNNQGILVQNDVQMNEELRDIQQGYLENVCNYLRAIGLKDPMLNDAQMYVDGKYTGIVERIQAQYGKELSNERFNTDELNNLFLDRKNNQTIIDGYNSWVILNNFDAVLRSTFGKSIYIDNLSPRFSGEDKYSLSNAQTSNMNSTWRSSDIIDVASEVSNIVKLLVSTAKVQGRPMTFNEFGYIIAKIKRIADENYDETINFDSFGWKTLPQFIASMKENPQRYLPEIFKKLNDYDFRKQYLNKYFNDFDTVLIQALNSSLFDPDNPLTLKAANDRVGYNNLNYFSYITEVCDTIYENKYLQYFRTSKNITYLRNLYDQTVDTNIRAIQDELLIQNSRRANPDISNISEIKEDDKLIGIKYDLQTNRDPDNNLYLEVYNTGKYQFIKNGNTVNISELNKKETDKLHQLINNTIDSTLFDSSDSRLYNAYVGLRNNEIDQVLDDFTKLTSHILLNRYIAVHILPEQGRVASINVYSGTDQNANLSNFSTERPVEINDKINAELKSKGLQPLPILGSFNSVEAAFHAQKLKYDNTHNEQQKQKILREYLQDNLSGSWAKQWGRKSVTISDTGAWNNVSPKIMESLIYLSFKQNPDSLNVLYNTGNAEITHKDGRGRTSDKKFPEALMKVRERLAEENSINLTERGRKKVTKEDSKKFFQTFYTNSQLVPDWNGKFGESYVTSQNEMSIIDTLARAQAIIDGKLTSAVLKDGEGNALPATALSRLNGSYRQQWELQGRDSAYKNFSLLRNGVFKGVFQAKEFKDEASYTTTALTDFSPAEMETSCLIYDYLKGLDNNKNTKSPVGNGKVAFLSTDNSDKPNIPRIIVDLNNITTSNGSLYDLLTSNTFLNEKQNVISQIISQELGDYYKNVINSIIDRYHKIQPYFEGVYQNISLEYNGMYDFQQMNEAYINSDRSITPLEAINNAARRYNQDHPNEPVSIIDTSMYIEDKNHLLNVNPLLIKQKNLFTSNNPGNINKYFEQQNTKIVADLLEDNFNGLYKDGENTENFSICTITDQRGNSIDIHNKYDLYSNWNKLVSDQVSMNSPMTDVIKDLISNGYSVEINPDIDLYNRLNYLFTQEWVLSTVGGAFNHPIKDKTAMTMLSPISAQDNLPTQQWEDMKYAALLRENGYDIDKLRTDYPEANDYCDRLEDALERDESSRYIAQTKRNVSFTAAMHAYELNGLQGLPSSVAITCIADLADRINTITGFKENALTSDGAMYINPFTAYWENGSLAAEKVGINKKQFFHFYDPSTGTGGIIKCAGFAITNEIMRMSIADRQMMKLSTDVKYKDQNGNILSNYNVLETYNGETFQFNNDKDTTGQFYIKLDGKYYRFDGMEYKGNNTYDQLLTEVSENGEDIGQPIHRSDIKDKNGNSYGLLSINSNYDLWNALGGYECYEIKQGDNKLTHSEYSIKAISDMANVNGIKLNDTVHTQHDLYQVMKQCNIHYMPTVGAVKQGAANIENINKYLKGEEVGDFRPNFLKIQLLQAGIQLDKEHNADSEDVSMFTQVISACASRGMSFYEADQLYKGLANLAKSSIRKYQEAFDQYLEYPETGKARFQNTVAELIGNALITQKNNSETVQSIVNKLLELNKNGEFFKYKDSIPFSDSQIYNKLISTVGVALTKAGIKVKMSGLLAVLCPSYDRIKLYGGKFLDEYQEGDLDRLQQEYNNNPLWKRGDTEHPMIDFETTYNLTVEEGQNPDDLEQELENLNAGDTITGSANTIQVTVNSVECREKLYELIRRGAISKIVENVKEGRNLRPYNITFKVRDNDGNEKPYSLYDIDTIKNQFRSGGKAATMHQLQAVLSNLDPNNPGDVTIEGETYEIVPDSIKIRPYEIVLPKVFASKYGLGFDTKLSDIVNDKTYFQKKLLNSVLQNIIPDNYYDIVFNSLDNNPIYVIDRNRVSSDSHFHRKEDVATRTNENGTVDVIDNEFNVLYTLSKNNNEVSDENPQDEIWEYVDDNGVSHDVIVTTDYKYWLDNTSSFTLNLSGNVSKNSQATLFNALNSSNNKEANRIYKRFAKGQDISKFFNNYNSWFERLKKDYSNALNESDPEKRKLNEYNFFNKKDESINHLLDIGQEIYTSFMKSLDMVASRIPAQSMQSFMSMRIVGFIDSDVNTAYVSTLQTYLQGSKK